MEQAKKFLGAALVITAGIAMYELLVKPMVDKAKTSLPSTK
jgi:hypothetical protein